jgi:hypothetical protein
VSDADVAIAVCKSWTRHSLARENFPLSLSNGKGIVLIRRGEQQTLRMA